MTKPRQFNIKDLILKRVSLATKDLANGNWEPIGKDHTESLTTKDEDRTT